jgi:hypothetical protein
MKGEAMKLQFDRKLPDKKVILRIPGRTYETLEQYKEYQHSLHQDLGELTDEEIIVRLLDTFLNSNTEAAWHAWRKRGIPNGKAKAKNGEVFTLGAAAERT